MKLNRKWILVMSLVLSLVLATGSTLAYLMDTTETKTNVFTLGDVEIELTEPSWVEEDAVLLPNKAVAKDPTITNTGWLDAYVWMDVAIPSALYDYLTLDGIGADWTKTVTDVNADGYRVVTLKYKNSVASGETVKAFDSVTLSADAKYENLKELGSKVQINVTAYAIEAGSFANVDLAYAAFSNDSTPDANAWNGSISENLEQTTLEIVPGGNQTGTITVNSAKDLLYLTKLSQEWVATYSNGQGTEVTNYRENNGGKGTDYYYHWTWTVELAADINLNNIPVDSITLNYWGNFDGKGHTISNVVLKDGQSGLFANMQSHNISNLTIENVSVNAPDTEGVGVLSHRTGTLNNVHVINASVKGGKYTGGLAGISAGITNSSVKNTTVTGKGKSVGGLAGYAVGDPGEITVTGNTVESVNVTGTYNVGGLVGHAQNGTFSGNNVKNVTVTSTSGLPAEASSTEKRVGEIAARIMDTATVKNNTVENVVCVVNVSNADELSALSAATMTGEINIMDDIDMNNANFSAIIAKRNGKLIVNGNGYKISNVKVVSGDGDNTTGQASMFYTFPGSSLEVSNLKLENITVNADANGSGYAAAVIGYCEGDAVLNNVDVNATVVGVKSSGMLCGHLSGSLTAKDCDVKGTVTLNGFSEEVNGHYAGKYIGTLAGAATLTNCTDNVTVSGNLNNANDGTIYGRKTSAGSLNQN